MKKASLLFLTVFLSASSLTAFADPWKDESGHGKRRGHGKHEFKEEYWDGNCKVERKLEKNGAYKEERKCKPHRHGHYHSEPVYVPAPPPPVVVDPGVTIHGTVRIP